MFNKYETISLIDYFNFYTMDYCYYSTSKEDLILLEWN